MARLGRLRLWCFVLLAALVAAGCGGPVAKPAPSYNATSLSDRVKDLSVDSAAVGHHVSVRLVLPTRFAQDSKRRWPVLYLLHGCCDNYTAWTRFSDIEALSARDDIMIVMPDGGKAGFYSNWVDGPAWETFHLTELRRLLVDDYRASDAEAVGGLSMGGLGALGYASRHPGRFRAAFSLSGLVDPRSNPGMILGTISAQDPSANPDDLWGDPKVDAHVWRAHDPTDSAKGLRGTPLFIYSGTGQPGDLDPAGTAQDPIETAVHTMNVALVAKLAKLDIPATVSIDRPGTHQGVYWQRELHQMWPWLVRLLDAPSHS